MGYIYIFDGNSSDADWSLQIWRCVRLYGNWGCRDYDLALLLLPKRRGKTKTKQQARPFPAVVVAAAAAPPKTKLVCVSQPGDRML